MKHEYRMYTWSCDICNVEGEIIITRQRPKIYEGWKVVRRGVDPFTTQHIGWGKTALMCPKCLQTMEARKIEYYQP